MNDPNKMKGSFLIGRINIVRDGSLPQIDIDLMEFKSELHTLLLLKLDKK